MSLATPGTLSVSHFLQIYYKQKNWGKGRQSADHFVLSMCFIHWVLPPEIPSSTIYALTLPLQPAATPPYVITQQ